MLKGVTLFLFWANSLAKYKQDIVHKSNITARSLNHFCRENLTSLLYSAFRKLLCT
jgi:hypothetical protein